MLQSQNLGEWIKQAYGDQGGLAEALDPPVAKNTVSSWKTGRNGIPPEYQKQIRKLGFKGSWPQQAQEAGGPYVTEAAFEAWRKFWYEGQERVLKSYEDRLKDLAQRIEVLEGKRQP